MSSIEFLTWLANTIASQHISGVHVDCDPERCSARLRQLRDALSVKYPPDSVMRLNSKQMDEILAVTKDFDAVPWASEEARRLANQKNPYR